MRARADRQGHPQLRSKPRDIGISDPRAVLNERCERAFERIPRGRVEDEAERQTAGASDIARVEIS